MATATTTPASVPTAIGTCPLCGGTLLEDASSYYCTDCDISICRVIAKRPLARQELVTLLTDRELGPLEGFTGKTGSTFTASLRLTDQGRVEFVFPEAASTPIGERCPACGADLVERSRSWSCSDCELVVWKEIAARAITRAELGELLERGRTVMLRGFRNKLRKPFSAALVLCGTEVRLEFPVRLAPAKRTAAAARA